MARHQDADSLCWSLSKLSIPVGGSADTSSSKSGSPPHVPSTPASRARKCKVPVPAGCSDMAKTNGVTSIVRDKPWAEDALAICVTAAFQSMCSELIQLGHVTAKAEVSLGDGPYRVFQFIYQEAEGGSISLRDPFQGAQHGFLIAPNVHTSLGYQGGISWCKIPGGIRLYSTNNSDVVTRVIDYVQDLPSEGPTCVPVASFGIITLYRVSGEIKPRSLSIPSFIESEVLQCSYKELDAHAMNCVLRDTYGKLKQQPCFKYIPFDDLAPVLMDAITVAYRRDVLSVNQLYSSVMTPELNSAYAELSQKRADLGLMSPLQELAKYFRENTAHVASQLMGIATPLVAGSALLGHFSPLLASGFILCGVVGAAAWYGPGLVSHLLRDAADHARNIFKKGYDWANSITEPITKLFTLPGSEETTSVVDPEFEVVTQISDNADPKLIAYQNLFTVKNAPMYTISNTAHALSTTLPHRFKPLPIPHEQQVKAWQENPTIRSWLQSTRSDWSIIERDDPLLRKQWEEHLTPAKLCRYTLAARTQDLAACSQKIDLMLKSGEKYTKTSDGCIKGRLIANVSPALQYYVGPSVYEATRRIKQHFNLTDAAVVIGGRRVVFSYGAGRDTKFLNDWFNATVQDPEVSRVICAGDDSVVYDSRTQTRYCSDFSSFDLSEGKGPLDLQAEVLYKMGMRREELDVLARMHRAKLVYNKNGEYISVRHARPFRMSGGPDTTVGNTVVSMAAWAAVLADKVTPEAFEALGFRVKLNPSEIHRCIFLRGRWIHVAERWHWTPCIGKILKLSMTKADLNTMFPKKTIQEQHTAYKAQMACSIGPYTWNPIWMALFEAWYVSGTILNDVMREKLQYAVVDSDSPQELRGVMDALALAYDMHPKELKEIMIELGKTASHNAEIDCEPLVRSYLMDYS